MLDFVAGQNIDDTKANFMTSKGVTSDKIAETQTFDNTPMLEIHALFLKHQN